MIVYNVESSFFALKFEADDYRRGKKLPYHATTRIDVRTRDELAALLNAVAAGHMPVPEPVPVEGEAGQADIYAAECMDKVPPGKLDDADIPEFLKKAVS